MNDSLFSIPTMALLSDSYKYTHWKQYPEKTENIYSYFESRGGVWKDIVFFGLQYYLKRYFSKRIALEDIDAAEKFCAEHFGSKEIFNRAGWEKIVHAHKGYLPVRICAVPEGSVVPVHNVLVTMENTDKDLPWLTNFLETILVMLWYPCTIATNSREIKKLWLNYLEKTGDPSTVGFKHHDFGFRGSTSVESSGLGSAAHLISFMGTDTISGIHLLKEYYNATMSGFSINATEHSTMTVWGEDREFDAVENYLDKNPEGLIACVGDSWDIYRFAEVLGTRFKERILGRKGVFILRPDSGDPATTTLRVLEVLGSHFGVSLNPKKYKVLPPQIRMIWGDGIDYMRAREILETLRGNGWSADNIAMGSGGGLLQKFDRDTQMFAFKCSHAVVNGEPRNVSKNPITDYGKRSKAGRLALVRNEYGNFTTINELELNNRINHLTPVFENGMLLTNHSLEEIRSRAERPPAPIEEEPNGS